MGKSIKEISDIAANWWADKVVSPKFDNRDTGENGLVIAMLAMMNKGEVSDDVRNNFANLLSFKIQDKLKDNSNWRQRVSLNVDYHPCEMLAEVADCVGLPLSNFPWKTDMWIDENHVKVSYGYRGKMQVLYANKKYYQTMIDSCMKNIKDYANGDILSWIKDEEERKRTAEERILESKKEIEEYTKLLEDAEE